MKDVRVIAGDWGQLRQDAAAVRYDVFVVEQAIPVELEWDEMDAVSLHAVAYDGARRAIGTGRLLPDGHIGRMAVRKEARGRGVGGLLLQALMEAAKQRGHQCVLLNAQTGAAPFYEGFGFVAEGEEFEEAGIPHIRMRRNFSAGPD